MEMTTINLQVVYSIIATAAILLTPLIGMAIRLGKVEAELSAMKKDVADHDGEINELHKIYERLASIEEAVRGIRSIVMERK
jgi:hypothetical protein